MKKIFLVAASVAITNIMQAQIYMGKTCVTHFFSKTSMKDIEAKSNTAKPVLDAASGNFQMRIQNTSFKFESSFMEEHFNENYLHTDKFPNATYKGKLIGFTKDMLTKDGVYNISSSGQVTLHGVTKDFSSPVKLEVKGKTATFNCIFKVKAEDYNIDIPGLVKPKLSEYTPLNATIVFQLN